MAADSCSFSSLGLSSWLVRQCEGLGFKEATPVQKNCIPPIMEGREYTIIAALHMVGLI